MLTRISLLFLILLFSAFFAVSSKADRDDVYGWDNLKWGMTGSEIQSVFGDRVKQRKPRVDKTYGLYAGLELTGVDMRGQELRASLWMDEKTDRLSKIVFVPKAGPSGYEWAETFIDIEEHLVSLYGAPDVEETSNDPGTTAERKWEFPSTVIEMSYMRIEDTELLLLIFSENGGSGQK